MKPNAFNIATKKQCKMHINWTRSFYKTLWW